jgi:hypothetical protein
MQLKNTALLTTGLLMGVSANAQSLPNKAPLFDGSGFVETYNVNNAPISLTGAFFQSLGTNGRSCASCHLPTEGWSVSAAEVQLRFLLTRGLDPIFRTNDGSNCGQNIDTSTLEGRRKAYSLLLSRGLIRISLPVPAGAQFTVENVSNPYGCSDTSTLSMYRRPLPATNLKFLSTLMSDGRESSPQTGTQKITYPDPESALLFDLAHQAIDHGTRPRRGSHTRAGTRHREFRDGAADGPGNRLLCGFSVRRRSVRRPRRAGFTGFFYWHQRFLPAKLWVQPHRSSLQPQDLQLV